MSIKGTHNIWLVVRLGTDLGGISGKNSSKGLVKPMREFAK